MKNIVKMGVGLTLIYFVAIVCTFVMADRVERLEGACQQQNQVAIFLK